MTSRGCFLHRALLAFAASLAELLAGCPLSSNPAPTTGSAPAKPKEPLVLLVADDPQLGQAIAREWRERTEEELTVREVTTAELASANRLSADAVIFPSGLIGQLAERGLILPLDADLLETPEFDHRDIFDQIRLSEMRWGNRTFAAPLGSPQLLLAYRVDIFEKLNLSPPADWSQYQQVVQRLADRAALGDLAPAADQPWRATVEPLADGWAGQLLLARAAAYALHRDQVSPLFHFDKLTPLVDQPPYVRALEELIAAAQTGIFADQRLTPAAALAELRSGRCAMALTWPAPEARTGAAKSNLDEVRIAFALLPGGRKAYRFATKTWEDRGPDENPHLPLLAVAGRMSAVSSGTADPRRAQGFVIWLAGREVSSQIGHESSATTLCRTSQIPDAGRWAGSLTPIVARQYAEVLAQTLALPRAFPGIRLPGRLDYLAALDEAVQRAVNGEKPAAESLAEAAQRWHAITEQIGADSQRRANARGLGQNGL